MHFLKFGRNSVKSRLFKPFFKLYFKMYVWGGNVCIWGPVKVLSPQMAKRIGFANCKSAKCHICWRSAKLKNYLRPQIYKFCYLRNLFADRPLLAICVHFVHSSCICSRSIASCCVKDMNIKNNNQYKVDIHVNQMNFLTKCFLFFAKLLWCIENFVNVQMCQMFFHTPRVKPIQGN